MKQRWSDEKLVERWTLTDAEKDLIDQPTDRGRLGFALLLKFFQIEGRFPRHRRDIPRAAITYLAELLSVPAAAWDEFPFNERSAERGRAGIRNYAGFRAATRDDA